MAEIQLNLERCSVGEQRSCTRAHTLLLAEWRGTVAKLLRKPAYDSETDEVLMDCVHDAMEPPMTALVPEGALEKGYAPRAWRLKKLKWVVKDVLRSKGRRWEIETWGGAGMSKEEVRRIREERARERALLADKEQPTRDELALSSPIEAGPERPQLRQSHDELNEAIDQRAFFRDNLPKLAVRKRVAIALELGFSPWVWADELATALGADPVEVYDRLKRQQRSPGDLELRARVFYPEGDSDKAKNAYRKLITNGTKDLRALAAGGNKA